MRGIGAVELQTGRLVLRPAEQTDVPDALAMLQDSSVRQWMPGPRVLTLESIRDWCRRSADWSEGTFAMWVVEEGGRFAGTSLLANVDSEDQLDAWVAYRIAPWARGRGIATEALLRTCEFAFENLGLERLELRHAIANAASCAVARNADFPVEGTCLQAYRDSTGKRWDTHLHARLAPNRQPPNVAPVSDAASRVARVRR
jgi:RimJ/RimL family protein N-acetyltransferase